MLEAAVAELAEIPAKTAENWDRQRFVAVEYQVSEQQPLRVATKLHAVASGERFDMHYALELGVVLAGRMERLYHHHQRTLQPGQVWLCGAWEPHGWRVVDGPCRALVVNIFPPTLANSSFPELGNFDWLSPFALPAAQRPQAPVERQPRIQNLAQQLSESCALPIPQRFVAQRMLVYQLLLELPRGARTATADASPHDAWGSINRAVELVFRERRYVSSQEAAKACRLSQKALNALFARALGISFAKFALRYRLQSAASQLLESRDAVKAIARDWGFVDASHFHAAFQASYGCSPVRYRENCSLG